MKILYIAVALTALLGASPAFAGYQTHSGHNYNGTVHTGSPTHVTGAATSDYGPSKDKYDGGAPKTGNPTHAYTSSQALSTAVPY